MSPGEPGGRGRGGAGEEQGRGTQPLVCVRVCVCSCVLMCVHLPTNRFRLVEEVRDLSGVAVADDEVFMNRTLEEFVKLVVLKGRGGGGVDKTVDYDKVSSCSECLCLCVF